MKVGQDKVVTIRYTLQVEGEVLDQGELSYLHGHRNLIPGLEEALEGREEGDAFQAHVPAAKAYGPHPPAGRARGGPRARGAGPHSSRGRSGRRGRNLCPGRGIMCRACGRC